MIPNDRISFYGEKYFVEGQYVNDNGLPSQDTEHLVRYAQRINEFDPAHKVLECGCAVGNITCGYRLSTPAIEAYGIDISDFAISHGNEKIRSFLRKCDLSDGIPYSDNEFDLVTGFDVLEHIPTYERLIKAVGEMCRVTRRYIFLRQPMTEHPLSATLEAEHEFISSLNCLPHSVRLSLLDRIPNIQSAYNNDSVEHPNTNPREFWIRLFENFGVKERPLPEEYYIFPNILHLHSFNCLLFERPSK